MRLFMNEDAFASVIAIAAKLREIEASNDGIFVAYYEIGMSEKNVRLLARENLDILDHMKDVLKAIKEG